MAASLGDLPEQVAAGLRPNVEILELTARHGMDLICYDDLPVGRLSRWVGRRIGRHWVLAVVSLCRHRNGEVLVATGEDVGFPLVIVHGLRRARRRARIGIISHGSYLRSRRAAMLGRLMSRRRDVVFLALSESVAGSMVERLGLRADQAVAVGYGTDLDFFSPPGRTSSNHDGLLVVAAGTANRDYDTLVAAMVGVDGELRIAADSAWFPEPVDVDLSEVQGRVEIRSYGDYVRLRALYAAGDVVVVPLHPALHACGYAVLAEAMAMGRPVIVTRTDGRSDLVEDGVTGWYVTAGDVAAIRDRLRSLAGDDRLRRQVGSAARAAMERHGSVAAYADRIASAVRRFDDPAS